jgi:hypothetical protein
MDVRGIATAQISFLGWFMVTEDGAVFSFDKKCPIGSLINF